MSDLPKIFSAPMVNALLEGRKTQTRRVLNPQPAHDVAYVTLANGRWVASDAFGHGYLVNVPYAVGDRLWVKEPIDKVSEPGDVFYRADYEAEYGGSAKGLGWRSARYMPRWASRLTLTVTDVRVQRLHDISEADAVAEGIEPKWHAYTGYGKQADVLMSPYDSFASLWISIHNTNAWDANPWVVALTFTVEKRNIDAGDAP